MSDDQSYRQILRSSSVVGGAYGLNYLAGLVRVKIVALLLGPAGVGMISLYTSVIGLCGIVSSFGINSSGVREVARAYSQEDCQCVSRTVLILRRACWITGLLGWLLIVALAPLLSSLVFGVSNHALAIATLGIILLLSAVSDGQTALLQGMCRINDLARIKIMAMLCNTCMAIGLYAWMGENGIVPVLITTAAISLIISWQFARQVIVAPMRLTWIETFLGAKHMASLGLAFMWSGLLDAGLSIATRTIITREYGIGTTGVYQAAWSLSGMFATFILNAMGLDFFPRLTRVINNHEKSSRLVNEQTEVGILLALPGLLCTLVFAPWAMEVFYSKSFLLGAGLLPWLVLGVFGRVVTWPLGFIQLAKGRSRLFAITETMSIVLQLILLLWMVPNFGVAGASYAFAIDNFVSVIVMLWVGRWLIGFVWSQEVKKLLLLCVVMILAGIGMRLILPRMLGEVAGGLFALVGVIISVRGLATRLGVDHRLLRLIQNIPGSKWIIHSGRE